MKKNERVYVNSMPEKGCTAKQVSKAVGCRITVGFLDAPAMAGILLPFDKGRNPCYRLLTVDKKGIFEIETFDFADQVIHIDESGRRALLDIIFTSPAEVAAKAELAKSATPGVPDGKARHSSPHRNPVSD